MTPGPEAAKHPGQARHGITVLHQVEPAAGLNAHGRAEDHGSVLVPELDGMAQNGLGRGSSHRLEAGAHQQDHRGQVGQAQAAA
jgi:hypothetical protein